MKIAIIGTGSIGGCLGAGLVRAGADVTFIARGATLDALRRDGLTIIEKAGIDKAGAREVLPVKAAAITDRGVFDTVILALKAHQIAAVAPALPALFHPDTCVVAAQNGMPWWYFYQAGGAYDGRAIAAVDPAGAIAANIGNARVIGAVLYVAASIVSPGVINVLDGSRIIVGEPTGDASARATRIAGALTRAGFPTSVSAAIRTDIWVKLWGNLSFNPISALTRATLADICGRRETRALATAIMTEAEQVAGRLGITMPVSIEQRIAVTEKIGAHKTSMLQDIEAGRAPEVEATVGAVVELARLTGVDTPCLDAIYACTALLAGTVTGHNASTNRE